MLFLAWELPINIKWNQFYKWVIVLRNVPDQILSLNLYHIYRFVIVLFMHIFKKTAIVKPNLQATWDKIWLNL